MATPGTSPLADLSQTARWVALYRAEESERPDALFRDRHARRLAGEPSEAVQQLRRRGQGMASTIAVRTAVFDELITGVIERERIDTVLMLAAGLDARPYRLPLLPTLCWHEVDLPSLIAEKEAKLAGEVPNCRVVRHAVDLRNGAARRALLDEVAKGAERALVVSEGLLVYLPPTDVDALARDLAARGPLRFWLTDLVSPTLLWMMLKGAGVTQERGAPPRYFAPREGTDFFRATGWRELTYRSTLADAVRLHRAPPAMALLGHAGRLVPGLGGVERIGGNVLLGRG